MIACCLLVLAGLALGWLLSRPAPVRDADTDAYRAYRHLLTRRDTLALAILVGALFTFLVAVVQLRDAADADLARLRNPCSGPNGEWCWSLDADGSWRKGRT